MEKSPHSAHCSSFPRCQFHFQQNAQAYVTSVRYRSVAAAHIRNVFNAGNRASARLMIQNTLSIFREDKQYKLADWFEENVEECLTVIDCPVTKLLSLVLITNKQIFDMYTATGHKDMCVSNPLC